MSNEERGKLEKHEIQVYYALSIGDEVSTPKLCMEGDRSRLELRVRNELVKWLENSVELRAIFL